MVHLHFGIVLSAVWLCPQLLQRESDDKAFQEQLEMEIAKRMETERAAQKVGMPDDLCGKIQPHVSSLLSQLGRATWIL